MTVYVDNAYIPHNGKVWCHLMADSLEELHTFADAIGLKRSWFQTGNHYDVTQAMRNKAVARGAVQVTSRDLVPLIRKLRQMPL